eukprot:TRINITY_DN4182_c0_g1_i1.p1 TRINITY_DN4182_c0_g1~~TRINITY_DN4182_c0_g1_i1.p1  ORF type:complete len:396 (-),score=62.56 TRINITY_DN4182_c0_g1_i1:92-1279(-)
MIASEIILTTSPEEKENDSLKLISSTPIDEANLNALENLTELQKNDMIIISEDQTTTPTTTSGEKKESIVEKGITTTSELEIIITDNNEVLSPHTTPPSETHPSTLCNICIDLHPLSNIHELSNCSHKYCKGCIVYYFTQGIPTIISNAPFPGILCPDPNCKTAVSEDDVKVLVSAQSYQMYIRLTTRTVLLADPNTLWCPKNCGGYTKLEFYAKGKSSTVQCSDCNYTWCSLCRGDSHDGKTCRQIEQMREKAQKKSANEFTKWTRSNKFRVKSCIYCSAFIEKNAGCNHMTCTQCKGQFCWLCMQSYSSSHYTAPGPCNGKQHFDPPPPPPRFQQFLKGVKIVLKVLGIAIFGIPVAVVCGPFYLCFKLGKYIKKRAASKKKWVVTPNGWCLE